MKNKKAYKLIVFFIIAITFMIPKEAFASPHFNLSVSSGDTPADYVDSIKILIFFTMLTLLPSFIIWLTPFLLASWGIRSRWQRQRWRCRCLCL